MGTVPSLVKPRARTGRPASASRRTAQRCTRQYLRARPPTSTKRRAIQSSCERWLPCVRQALHARRAPPSPAAATPPQNAGARSPVTSAAAAGRVPPSAKPHARYAARHAASSATSTPSTRARPCERSHEGPAHLHERRSAERAAPRRTKATRATNAAGRSGVCQNSTDASPCRSTPGVGRRRHGPATTPAAAASATRAAREA